VVLQINLNGFLIFGKMGSVLAAKDKPQVSENKNKAVKIFFIFHSFIKIISNNIGKRI
jgi:hypothetical protein